MGQELRVRPSVLAGVGDPYTAYCLDEAAYLFGSHVESELRRVSDGVKKAKDAQRKRQQTLASLLAEDPPEATAVAARPQEQDPYFTPEQIAKLPPAKKFDSRHFRDPAETFAAAAAKKVRVEA